MSGSEIALIISPIATALVALVPIFINAMNNRSAAKMKIKELNINYFENHEQAIINELFETFGKYSQYVTADYVSQFIAALSKAIAIESFGCYSLKKVLELVIAGKHKDAIDTFCKSLNTFTFTHQMERKKLFSNKKK